MTGEQIKAARKARRWSQAALALAIGSPGGQTYISAIERGAVNPTPQTQKRIAAALGMNLNIEYSLTELQPQAATSAA